MTISHALQRRAADRQRWCFLIVERACSQSPGSVALRSMVTTVAAGYPFAVQVRNGMDHNANLMTVVVDLDRRGEQFNVPQIVYGFASPHADGRVFAVSVDNTKRKTFALMDVPNSPDSPHMSARRLPCFASSPCTAFFRARVRQPQSPRGHCGPDRSRY